LKCKLPLHNLRKIWYTRHNDSQLMVLIVSQVTKWSLREMFGTLFHLKCYNPSLQHGGKICVKIRDVTPALFQSFPGLTKSEMLHDQPCNGVWPSYKQMYFFSSKTYRISHTTLSKTEMITGKERRVKECVSSTHKKKGGERCLIASHTWNERSRKPELEVFVHIHQKVNQHALILRISLKSLVIYIQPIYIRRTWDPLYPFHYH